MRRSKTLMLVEAMAVIILCGLMLLMTSLVVWALAPDLDPAPRAIIIAIVSVAAAGACGYAARSAKSRVRRQNGQQ